MPVSESLARPAALGARLTLRPPAPVPCLRAGASSGVPTAVWKAHDALVTSLLKSPFGLTLFSGAADGKVHV